MPDTVDSSLKSRSAGKKSPDAFRTISEVADALNVPQHVLRFWEGKFSQVKPMKRGGGRRYYRPEDVHLLRGIRNLLYHEGYTIRGVQKVLREAGTKVVVDAGRDSGGDSSSEGALDAGLETNNEYSATESGSEGSVVSAGMTADQRVKLVKIMARLKEIRGSLNAND